MRPCRFAILAACTAVPDALTLRETQLVEVDNKPTLPGMNPGDQTPPGTAGTGENICRKCSGKGYVNGEQCEECGGSGKVVEGIGGA